MSLFIFSFKFGEGGEMPPVPKMTSLAVCNIRSVTLNRSAHASCVYERTFNDVGANTPTGAIPTGIERRSVEVGRLNSDDHLFGGARVSLASVTSRHGYVEHDHVRAVPEQLHICRYDSGVRVDGKRRRSGRNVARLWVVAA